MRTSTLPCCMVADVFDALRQLQNSHMSVTTVCHCECRETCQLVFLPTPKLQLERKLITTIAADLPVTALPDAPRSATYIFHRMLY